MPFRSADVSSAFSASPLAGLALGPSSCIWQPIPKEFRQSLHFAGGLGD